MAKSSKASFWMGFALKARKKWPQREESKKGENTDLKGKERSGRKKERRFMRNK